MADDEQVKLLKSDVREWNKWREENRDAAVDIAGADLSGASLLGADLAGARASGANLSKATLLDVDLRQAFLLEAKLVEAKFGSSQPVDDSWWPAALAKIPDSVAWSKLAKLIVEEGGADLSGAVLFGADFAGASLANTDLRGADLRKAKFPDADLTRADLRETNLRDADLEKVHGLQPDQLAGALTSLAKLPKAVGSFEMLQVVEKASANARKIFMAMLLGCAYAILTIATTKDAQLLANSATSPLPIIQVQIPVVGFYIAAPLILLGFYVYFQFCMQNIWERLATLPAELPDGRTLDKAADPWLLLGLVQAHFKRLKDKRTFLSRFQHVVSIILAWWAVPLTLFLLWLRYIRRHDAVWTTWQIALLLAATAIGIYTYRRAVRTLRGESAGEFSVMASLKAWRRYASGASATVLVGMLAAVVSAAAIRDWRWADRNLYFDIGGDLFLQPDHVGLRIRDDLLTADISSADVSTKPSGWTGAGGQQIELVKAARLQGRNLRGVRAERAFLVRADLAGADLRGARLLGADLREARLFFALLAGADLSSADLRNASFSGGTYPLTIAGLEAMGFERSVFDSLAVPRGAGPQGISGGSLVGAWLAESDLRGADLSGVDMTGAMGLTQQQLSEACADSPMQLPEGLKQPPPCTEEEAE